MEELNELLDVVGRLERNADRRSELLAGRDTLIRRLHSDGRTGADLARLTKLSRERIGQIVK
jgi:hypothetical protein